MVASCQVPCVYLCLPVSKSPMITCAYVCLRVPACAYVRIVAWCSMVYVMRYLMAREMDSDTGGGNIRLLWGG